MTEVLNKIRSRGYCRVRVRPEAYVERRIQHIGALQHLLEKSVVKLRGWDYPHIDRSAPVRRFQSYVMQETDWSHYVEMWRFYQSGQFVHYFGLREDWFEDEILKSRASLWGKGPILLFVSTIFELTEIFEFAARLSLTEAGDDPMSIDIALTGLKGRRLRPSDLHVWLPDEYAAEVDEFNYATSISRGDLVARPREFAAQASQQLFAQFGLDLELDVLRAHQEGLRRP
jgi:hypothetical protein